MDQQPLKISLTGSKFSDKTKLAKALAHHYKTYYVPDYAREYLEMINRPYRETDLLNIGKGQYNSERDYSGMVSSILFCDSCVYSKMLFADFKYGEHHPWFDRKLKDWHYDYFFVVAPSAPENKPKNGELFENKDKYDFHQYLVHHFKQNKIPFSILDKANQPSIEKAKQIIEKLL